MLRLFTPQEAATTPDRARLLSQTTAIIKTFQRSSDLDRLIRSMRRYYPELKILVGDDGFEPSPRTDVGYIRLPEDIGLSAGRNALLERVETPYFLLLDDDWQFFGKTKIEKLTQLVDEGELDIAAGNHVKIKRKLGFIKRRKLQPYHGTFDFHDNKLHLIRGGRETGKDYLLCDIVHNFFVARVDTIRAWALGTQNSTSTSTKSSSSAPAHRPPRRLPIRCGNSALGVPPRRLRKVPQSQLPPGCREKNWRRSRRRLPGQRLCCRWSPSHHHALQPCLAEARRLRVSRRLAMPNERRATCTAILGANIA